MALAEKGFCRQPGISPGRVTEIFSVRSAAGQDNIADMFGKKNQPPFKEYPEPEFPDKKARAAYRKAQGIIKKAWQRMQAGEEVTSLVDALAAEDLTALPPEIGQLTALTELYLNGNRLTALPPEIGQLTALTSLDLDDNQLTALPPEIGQLTALTELYLHNNQLTALPPEIGQLTALAWLHLYNNQLTALPPEIGQLTALTGLYLHGNQLTALPREIGQCEALTRLFLHGNEGLGLDPAVLGPTIDEVYGQDHKLPAPPRYILAYYFHIQKGARPLDEVKLLLLGRGGSGKTATVNRLVYNTFKKGTVETVGIEITDWRPECPGGGTVLVHGWDFAGQKVPRAMHAFFLSHRSVYLLVLAGGREGTAQEDAEEWLKLVEAYGKDQKTGECPPVIVTLNHWENERQTRPEVDQRSLEEKYPFIAGWVETDCDTGYGFDRGPVRLPEKLRALIGGMEWVRGPFPAEWHEAKEFFTGMKENYLPYTSFQELAEQKGVKREEVMSFAAAMHRLGLALNYGESLQDTTVLNPHWVTRTTYKILKEAPRAGDAVMNLDDVAKVLPDEQSGMRAYAVELMRRFGMVFALPEKENHWLVPARLPETQPAGIAEGFGDKVEGATRVRVKVYPLPPGLVPGFITRTHLLSDDLPQWRWANGVVLALDGAQALVRADHAERMVQLTLTGAENSRPTLASLARTELARLFAEIPGLNPEEEMEVRPGVWQAVALMEEMERDKQLHLPVLVGKKVEKVEVKTELNKIRPPAARDEEVWKPTVFISYSHKDEKLKVELADRLKVFQAAGLLGQVWQDRMLEPGELWESAIIKELERVDIVVLLISNAALASDFIRTKELKVALTRAEAGTAVVVPVILEQCHWKLGALEKLQAFPKDAEPVRKWKPRNAGWFNVMEALRRKIETMLEQRK